MKVNPSTQHRISRTTTDLQQTNPKFSEWKPREEGRALPDGFREGVDVTKPEYRRSLHQALATMNVDVATTVLVDLIKKLKFQVMAASISNDEGADAMRDRLGAAVAELEQSLAILKRGNGGGLLNALVSSGVAYLPSFGAGYAILSSLKHTDSVPEPVANFIGLLVASILHEAGALTVGMKGETVITPSSPLNELTNLQTRVNEDTPFYAFTVGYELKALANFALARSSPELGVDAKFAFDLMMHLALGLFVGATGTWILSQNARWQDGGSALVRQGQPSISDLSCTFLSNAGLAFLPDSKGARHKGLESLIGKCLAMAGLLTAVLYGLSATKAKYPSNDPDGRFGTDLQNLLASGLSQFALIFCWNLRRDFGGATYAVVSKGCDFIKHLWGSSESITQSNPRGNPSAEINGSKDVKLDVTAPQTSTVGLNPVPDSKRTAKVPGGTILRYKEEQDSLLTIVQKFMPAEIPPKYLREIHKTIKLPRTYETYSDGWCAENAVFGVPVSSCGEITFRCDTSVFHRARQLLSITIQSRSLTDPFDSWGNAVDRIIQDFIVTSQRALKGLVPYPNTRTDVLKSIVKDTLSEEDRECLQQQETHDFESLPEAQKTRLLEACVKYNSNEKVYASQDFFSIYAQNQNLPIVIANEYGAIVGRYDKNGDNIESSPLEENTLVIQHTGGNHWSRIDTANISLNVSRDVAWLKPR